MSMYFKGQNISPVYNNRVLFKETIQRTIKSLTLDDLSGVTTISDSAFYGCYSLKTVVIPNTVTSITTQAFRYSYAINSFTFEPNSQLTTIGASAFRNINVGLTSITLPASVTSIGNDCFANDSNLQSFTILAVAPPTLGSGVFTSTHANLVIYVPAGSVDAYKAATNWATYASRIQAIPS